MSQTKEQRIYKHYQSQRHNGKMYSRHNGTPSFGHNNNNDDELILWLAKHWKMKCREIKDIVRAKQAENKASNPEPRCEHVWFSLVDDIESMCHKCGQVQYSPTTFHAT